MDCETSSYKYDSSPVKASTDTVLWTAGDIECLGICNNIRLSEAQVKIVNKICELVGIVDMSTINVPECLRVAFLSNDYTILSFIQFLLDQHCSLKSQVNGIQDGSIQIQNFDPIFTIEYTCCDDSCIAGTTLKLSEHIQKILLCLCQTKSDLATLTNTVDLLSARVTSLETFQSTTNTTLATINTSIASLKVCTECP